MSQYTEYTLTTSDTVDVLARMAFGRGEAQWERKALVEAAAGVEAFMREGGPHMTNALVTVLNEVSDGVVDFTAHNFKPAFEADWHGVFTAVRTKALEGLAAQCQDRQDWLEDVGEVEYLKWHPGVVLQDGRDTTHPWGPDGEAIEKFLTYATVYQIWRCFHEAQEAAFRAIRENVFDYILEQAPRSAEKAAAKTFQAECAKLAKTFGVAP